MLKVLKMQKMQLITSPAEIQLISQKLRQSGKNIGFVPTMGAMHDGHLSLIKQAKSENDTLIVSIFVNPTQFDQKEDFETYPVILEKDLKLSEAAGVNLIFAPSADQMYPKGYSTFVNVEGALTQTLCGAKRPGHFRGVATIVCKLFNLIRPHRAYFGEKDAQQLRIIKRMVADFNFDIEVVPMPLIRDSDGLAISSRNKNLSSEERQAALAINRSLSLASDLIKSGERNSSKIKGKMVELISKEPLCQIDYISIVDPDTLQDVAEVSEEALIAVAVFVGKTRLIDNIQIK